MVAAVHFFATDADERLLLEHIFGTADIRIFPWVKMPVDTPIFVDLEDVPPQADSQSRFGILNSSLGNIEFVNQRPQTLGPGGARSYVFKMLNWDAAGPASGEGIVDWERTPALFWDRSKLTDCGLLTLGNIGSQAEAMHAVSDDYAKWVTSVMGWVRRASVKVAERGAVTPAAGGFDITVRALNALYALPDAIRFFEQGGGGREWA